MKSRENSKMKSIGVFYDGNYFLHVSNYYNYVHDQRNRLSIAGLHQFIQHKAAELEESTPNLCRIVDSHFFRGRFTAKEANQKENQLYYDRVFDDILMFERVITHYMPMKKVGGRVTEKGTDVWFALEAYELTVNKQFDIVVLIASDGDHVPLVRKLNALGTRVMLVSWDFEYENDYGETSVTRTSQDLREVANYPLDMHQLINDGLDDEDEVIQDLFVISENKEDRVSNGNVEVTVNTDGSSQSEVLSKHTGYGFIAYPDNNLFFYHTDVIDIEFADLVPGDMVEFDIEQNEKGESVAKNVRLVEGG